MDLIGIICGLVIGLFCGVVLFFLFRKFSGTAAGTAEENMLLTKQIAAAQAAQDGLKQQFDAEKLLLNERFENEKKLLADQAEEKLRHQQDLFAAEKENWEKASAVEKNSILQQKELELSAKDKALSALQEQYESRLKSRQELAESEALRQQGLFNAEKLLLKQKIEELTTQGQEALSRLSAEYEEKLTAQQKIASTEISGLKSAHDSEKKNLLQNFEEVKTQFARSMAEMEKNHQTRLSLMKEEFKTLSDAILEEKSGKLHEANKKQLEAIIHPLSEKMGEFRTAVEESKAKGIELNAALSAQLGKMMEETSRIGGEAKELVNALRGQQKTQGDWGEMILEEILQSSGLQAGRHYEQQVVLRDDAGKTLHNEESEKTMRPDVIVHYPDGKDIIIDSKVSLTAYVDYMNAETDPDRKAACARHIRSVKSHIEELRKKNYSAYLAKSGRETIDFVIMFIPNEGPYHLAMISEPTLWSEAFRQNVLIISPVNLMALLKIIHIAWSREEQNRNQQAILDTAAELLERLYLFYTDFDAVGEALDGVAKKYAAATRRLKQEGRNHSVVLSGEKLKTLGVRMSKKQNLPARLQPLCELPEPAAENSPANAEEKPLPENG